MNPSQPRGHRDRTRAEPTQPDRDGYTGAGGTQRLNTNSPGPGTVQSPKGALNSGAGPLNAGGARGSARGGGAVDEVPADLGYRSDRARSIAHNHRRR